MSPAHTWTWDGWLLTPLHTRRASRLAAYHAKNKDRLRPYSPQRSEAFFTAGFWRVAKRRARRAWVSEIAYRWALCEGASRDACVIGFVALDQIVRGVGQSAVLGYSIDGDFEGRGLMRQSVERVLDYAFNHLALNRIAADHIPENDRSAALLASLGFQREGYARDYLKLDGVWRDHVLNALLASEFRQTPHDAPLTREPED